MEIAAPIRFPVSHLLHHGPHAESNIVRKPRRRRKCGRREKTEHAADPDESAGMDVASQVYFVTIGRLSASKTLQRCSSLRFSRQLARLWSANRKVLDARHRCSRSVFFRLRKGSLHTSYTSSRNANRNLSTPGFSVIANRVLCSPKLKNNGDEEVTWFAALALRVFSTRLIIREVCGGFFEESTKK